jgi:hypothetical protein
VNGRWEAWGGTTPDWQSVAHCCWAGLKEKTWVSHSPNPVCCLDHKLLSPTAKGSDSQGRAGVPRCGRKGLRRRKWTDLQYPFSVTMV